MLERWGVYRLKWNGKKNDKPPYNARTHQKGNPIEESERSSYEIVCRVLETRKDYAGAGYALQYSDGYTCTDFDHCVDASGAIELRIQKILDETASYAEFSPSGTGIHLWTKGWQPPLAAGKEGTKVGNVEMYGGKHYMTVSGLHVPSTPLTIESRDLSVLYQRIVRGEFKPAAAQKTSSNGNHSGKLERLMAGIFDDYPTQSEADLALARLLMFKHRGDSARVDEEFRRSGLYREKWDREDYRNKTLAMALASYEKMKPKDEFPPATVWNSDDFRKTDFPQREAIVTIRDTGTPLFTKHSVNEIFAWRGTGKSMIAMALAGAASTGAQFLNWKFPRPLKVIYVDGEMPNAQIQERMREQFTEGARIRLITLDDQPRGIPSLATREGQEWLERELEDEDILILDSVASLAPFATNEEELWIPFSTWQMRLRSRGFCVIRLMQAGKAGLQRSHSRSEDLLDVQIKLTAKTEREYDHLALELTYEKCRSRRSGRSMAARRIQSREVEMERTRRRQAENSRRVPLPSFRGELSDDRARTSRLGSKSTIERLMRKLKAERGRKCVGRRTVPVSRKKTQAGTAVSQHLSTCCPKTCA